jgi:hypothetical protein
MAVALMSFVVAFTAMKFLSTKMMNKEEVKLVKDSIDAIFGVVSLPLSVKAALVAVACIPLLAAAVMLSATMLGFLVVYTAAEQIRDKQDKVDISAVMKPVEHLIGIMATAAEGLKDMSLEAAISFAIMMKSTLDAAKMIVDMIEDLASPQMVNMIPVAQKNFMQILRDFFGFSVDGENVSVVYGSDSGPTLMGVLKGVSSAGELSEGQLRAVQALVPLTQSLDAIIDVIIKIQQAEDPTAAIAQLFKIQQFIVELTNFAKGFSGGFLGFGDDRKSIDVARESIDKMMPLLDSIQALGDKIKELGEGSGVITSFNDLGQSFVTLNDSVVSSTATMTSSIKQFAQSFDGLRQAFISLNSPTTGLTRAISDLGKTLGGLSSPMNRVNVATSDLGKFESAVKRVGRTLKDFTKENQSFFGGFAQIGAGVMSFVNDAMNFTSRGSSEPQGMSKSGGSNALDDPFRVTTNTIEPISKMLEKIQRDVEFIRRVQFGEDIAELKAQSGEYDTQTGVRQQ